MSVGGCLANGFLAALRAPRTRPLVIAHRGDSSHAPENTLVAARLAWEAGADAWELDVQLTRDRVPVVVHDESLGRTTDVVSRFPGDPEAQAGYLVSDLDLEEIRSLDAGAWFVSDVAGVRTASDFGTFHELKRDDVEHYRSGEVRVPTLRECLELTVRLDWLVNVELKSFPNTDPELVPVVLAQIEAMRVADRVLVSSFDHGDAARAARAGLGLATGVLSDTPLHRPDRYVREVVGADCYHASSAALGALADRYRRRPCAAHLRTEGLDALAVAGIPVLIYTVNDTNPCGLSSHLVGAGVSGVFTDKPGAMLEALGNKISSLESNS